MHWFFYAITFDIRYCLSQLRFACIFWNFCLWNFDNGVFWNFKCSQTPRACPFRAAEWRPIQNNLIFFSCSETTQFTLEYNFTLATDILFIIAIMTAAFPILACMYLSVCLYYHLYVSFLSHSLIFDLFIPDFNRRASFFR